MVKKNGTSKKKIIFIPQNDKFGCILTQVRTGRKRGQSLEVSGSWDTDFTVQFIRETKLRKTVLQTYPNVHGQRKGGRRTTVPSPPLNTPLVSLILSFANGAYFTLGDTSRTTCTREISTGISK